jgi:integrase
MEHTMTEQEQRRWKRIMRFADWDWNNPEEVYDTWLRKDHETVGKRLDSIFEDCDNKKIRTLYFNYEFFENQILAFVESDYFAYSKARWILKQYFKSLVGDIPDYIPDDYEGSRRTYHPEFGTTDDWMNFIKACDELYHDGMTAKVMKEFNRMNRLYEQYLNR